jgi:adenosylcobinamide-GDP ribazoletransferase
MFSILTDFAVAWRLLTIIPLSFFPADYRRPAGFGAAYYPLVGLILGLLLAGSDWLLSAFLPPGSEAALLLGLWVGLTGMLHLDGFMDCCDGLLPPRDPVRRLEIMKDSHVGAFGVIGAILLLLIKFNALVALPEPVRASTLVVAPTLARWGMTWAMAHYPLARREGSGVFFVAGLGWRQVLLASITAASVALLLLKLEGLLLLCVTWLTMSLVALLALARIRGLTGDVYGAIGEVTETILLIVMVVTPLLAM